MRKNPTLLFLFLCLFSIQCFATHIVGGEMIVTWISGNTYQIKAKVYRDCFNGVPQLDDPLIVSVFDAQNNWIEDVNIPSPVIATLNPNTFNNCLTAPPNICVQEGVYTINHTFPPAAGGYILAYQRCCRNNSILNIANPGSTGATYTQSIPDGMLFPHNSSPRFTLFPPILVCVNHMLVFDHSATDPDGDNLTYSLFNPYAGFSSGAPGPGTANPPPFTPVTFTGPYSVANQMGGAPILTINPVTGQLTVFPTTIGQFVVGICCTEKRNGQVIGVHYRDFQFNVLQCIQPITANFTPSVTSLTGCAGSPIVFTNTSVGANSYLWHFGDGANSSVTNPTHTYAAAGVYTVTLIAGPGQACADSATATITIHPIPVTTAQVNSPICVGTAIHLTTPTVAGATYSWTGPNGFNSTSQNPNINNAQVANGGTYTLVITVLGCQSNPINVTCVVHPYPAAPILTSNSPVCTGTNLHFTCASVAGASYAWTGPNGFTSNAQNPNVPNAQLVNAGTYTCTITVNGCATSSTIVVSIIVTPLSPVATNNSPFCIGGLLQLAATTIPGCTYHWTGPNGFVSNQQNPQIGNAQPNMSGTFTVVVTSANGCTSVPATTVVQIFNIPVVTPTNNSPLCNGQPVNLFANFILNAGYSWTGPNGFTSTAQNPVINPATINDSGIYSCVLSLNGCPSVSATTHVIIYPIPAAPIISSNTPVCTGQQIIFSAQNVAGGSFNWSGVGGWTSTQQNPVRNNATLVMAGIYSATVTVNGCTSPSSNTNVVVNPTPAPTITSTSPVCVGQSISFSTPTVTPATYAWSGPTGWTSTLQNPTINNLTLAFTGNYSLVVTSNGCSNVLVTTFVTVNPIPAPPVISATTPACTGHPINFTAQNVAGGSFSWTGPNAFSSLLQNPSIASAVMADSGNYSATVAVNGCVSPPSTVHVTVLQTPIAPSISNNAPLCVGSTLNLTTPFATGAVYSWTGPNGFTSALQNPSIPNAQVVNSGTYSLTITIAGCVSGTTTDTASIYPIPTSAFTVATPVCSGQNTAVVYSGTGTPNANFNWNFNGGNISSQAFPTYQINWTNAGNYNVDLTVTEHGCVSPPTTIPVTVLQTPGNSYTVQTPICLYDSSLVTFTGITQGAATFNWNFGNAIISSGTNQGPYMLHYANFGQQQIILSVTENGCTSLPDSQFIQVNPIPSSNFNLVPDTLCPNENTLATTLPGINTAAANYAWTYNGALLQSGNGVGPLTLHYNNPGHFTVTLLVNDLGCVSPLTTQNLFVDSLPIPRFVTLDTLGCAPYTVHFTNNSFGATNYTWDFGDESTSTATNPTHVYGVGVYSVTMIATNENGCRDSSGYNNLITVLPAPVAQFSVSPSPFEYVELQDATYQFVNHSQFSTHYLWYFGDGDTTNVLSPWHVYTDTGYYSAMLIAFNNIGCTDTAIEGPLTVIPKANYFIPNAFTPNDDGVNDFFFVYGQSLKAIDIKVYDRWGEMVFESEDRSIGWDGTFHGHPMNTAVFVYICNIETLAGKKYFVKGDVTLIR